MIFGFLRVVNFAHGSFYLLGGFVAVSIAEGFGNFWPALILVPAVVGIFGYIVERLTLRPTYDIDPITQVLVTIGVAFFIEGLAIIIWGTGNKSVDTPVILSDSINLLSISYPIYRLFAATLAIMTLLLTWIYLNYTDTGLAIQAGQMDKPMAVALGYDMDKLYSIIFSLGVSLTALSAVLLTPMRGISHSSATSILLLSFIVVVIGGLGSYRGTVISGIFVGLSDILLQTYISFRASGIAVFLLLIIVLAIRPRGLYGAIGVFD
jgi:branched-chain amino acid transport system permease protein